MRALLLAAVSLLGAAAAAQTADVTFRVDLSVQIEAEVFDPATEFVDVAGSFNGWGSPLSRLDDADGDAVYETTVEALPVGAAIAFKFRMNGQWDGREEFPGGGSNRSATVQAGENVIEVWYNDEAPPTGPPVAAIGAPATVFAGGLAAFRDRSAGAVASRAWTFEGGTPATSQDPNPTVRYATAGTYDVTLVAIGPEGRDTLAVEVDVRERPPVEARWWNDAVFYEVFVRSFADSDGDGVGDVRGLTARLDYLNDGDPDTDTDLGVTGLWLMPIHASPSYHGYDVTDYRSVNSDFGTMDDVRAFLDAAHARGIRVVIDYVVNHSSSQHPWFQKAAAGDPAFRDFYRWSTTRPAYDGPWGQTVWHGRAPNHYYGLFWGGMPDLNYDTPAVRDSVFDAATFWLEDVGVDGFRLDAVKHIDEDGEALADTPETFAFWRDFDAHLATSSEDAVTVCEAWSSTGQVVPYLLDGGLDLCFEFDLAGQILAAAQTGNATRLATAAQDIFAAYPPLQVATFLTNHDQDRVMSVLGRDVGKARVAASLLLTLPGVPFVYYGEEVGMVGQKPDERIRVPMQWADGPGVGFTTGRPWIAPNRDVAPWTVEAQDDDPASLLSHYRRLIHARTASEALRRGDIEAVPASSPAVMAFLRRTEAETVLVVVNTSDAAVASTLALPPDALPAGAYKVEDLVAERALATLAVTAGARAETLPIGAQAARVLRVVAAVDAEAPTPDAFGLAAPSPNPAASSVRLSVSLAASAPARLDVFDALGRRVRTHRLETSRVGTQTARLDVRALAPGVYSVRLAQGERHAAQRLVVAR